MLTSHAHGKTKPHESIFRAVLELLDVDAPQAAMVGDTLHEDIEGALAVGMTRRAARPGGAASRDPGAARGSATASSGRSAFNRLPV